MKNLQNIYGHVSQKIINMVKEGYRTGYMYMQIDCKCLEADVAQKGKKWTLCCKRGKE
jgi:hypothetical protein